MKTGATELYLQRLNDRKESLYMTHMPLKLVHESGDVHYEYLDDYRTLTDLDVPDFFPDLTLSSGPVRVVIEPCEEETGLWLVCRDGCSGDGLLLFNNMPLEIKKPDGCRDYICSSYSFEWLYGSWGVHVTPDVFLDKSFSMKPYSDMLNVKLRAADAVAGSHSSHDMTRMDDPHTDRLRGNLKIYVCRENDIQGMKVPHFHVIGYDFEFEVYIEHIRDLVILGTKRIDKRKNAGTWKCRMDIRDAVVECLDKPNTGLSPITNASAILAQWNINNPDHKVPQSFKD